MTDRATLSSEPEYLTMAALCRRLAVSRATVYRQGLLAFAVKVGRVWRFDWRAVRDYLETETDKEWPRAGA